MTQRQMGCKVDLEQQRQLMNMLGEEEEREKARLLSVTIDHTGDWLNTPPLKALGLHLRAPEFVLAIKYRLGCQSLTPLALAQLACVTATCMVTMPCAVVLVESGLAAITT